MKVTVLDTETGQRRTSTGMRTSEWEYGNWSCDCNRALLFGEGVMHELFAKERHQDAILSCLGCQRFIVVAAEPETDNDYDSTLPELNLDYPTELLAKHGIKIKNHE